MSCEFNMFTEAEVKKRSKDRLRIIIPGLTFGVMAIFGYFGFLVWVKEPLLKSASALLGPMVSNVLLFVLMLLVIPLFLTPILIAERLARKHSLICPNCNADLNLLVPRVLKTRCCSKCGSPIVEGGRVRQSNVYDRWRMLRARHFLVYWFWIWPIVGTICILSIWTMPSTFQNFLQMPMLFGLIGTSSTGWALIRTRDKRYLLSFLASTVLLAIGLKYFWEMH